MKSRFEISLADRLRDWGALKRVREAVFVAEQGVPPELEWDEIDPDCVHILARNEEGSVVGVARLCPGGHIGRMAVLAGWRGMGVGRAMLQFLLDHANREGVQHLHLNAQVSAVGFYEKAGFQVQGGEFMDAGIPHLRMIRDSGPACTVGEDPQEYLLSDRAEVGRSIMTFFQQARRSVDVLWPKLDVDLFGTPDAIDTMRAFVTENRVRQLRLLVTDAGPLVENAHPLLELARRMPSRIGLRVVQAPYSDEDDAYLVADETAYLRSLAGTEFRVRRCCDGRGESRRLAGLFLERWNHAREDPRLRRLPL